MRVDRRDFLPLPRDAARCMELALPVLNRFFDMDRFIIGGGSALAARWHHRVSTDVDLFTESREEGRRLHAAQDQIRAALEETFGRPVPVLSTPEHGSAAFPGAATLEWSSTARLTPKPAEPDYEPISGLPLDWSEEILAQKIYSRMYESGRMLVRDVYDLGWAADHVSSDLFRPAVKVFSAQEFEKLLNVLKDIRDYRFPIDRSKPILDPADPLFEFRALDAFIRGLERVRPRAPLERAGAARGR